ncbi:MAG TPA: hypothetical protein VFM05_06650, partial [Candidatus Saccharimonadales bacterium]|nr:hypothetical protein [Candidatus Saccharimonadales bacterium]
MRRRIAAFSLSFLVFFSSFGIAGLGMVQQVSAVGCSDPAYWFGRAKWCGYFKNVLDTDGESVRPGGLPASVNTTQELVSLVRADLASGDIWRITAAQFFILTMLGRGPGLPKSVTAAQVADWEARVLTYGNVSQNGTTSVGSNGRIDWFVWQHMPCGARNTYYQDTFRD